ncbi:hypothetical protein PMIN01_09441 [Paraphaeosphaeria minitans]|uniref:Uncharacterized protein n=1 Tax=Paraphaeosphaeria minitans TaxID=565426 RepID=A0A9P6GCG1_9PLEO|nr:hypothetical protein PMIN01_09441 [Paraphaeosphaeria minitans]
MVPGPRLALQQGPYCGGSQAYTRRRRPAARARPTLAHTTNRSEHYKSPAWPTPARTTTRGGLSHQFDCEIRWGVRPSPWPRRSRNQRCFGTRRQLILHVSTSNRSTGTS